jgi:hypothetical protein
MAILWVAMSFSVGNENKGKLTINLEHYVGSRSLSMDSVLYKNEAGQLFTITNFKYYISNIHLKKADGKEFISQDHFLITEENESSKHFSLNNIPNEEYTSMSFILGVDSIHNCSGAQSGALDPVNGMFWAWNSGYIFLKLEGKAVASTSSGHIFEFHIGGYKQPSNCIRTVNLNFNEKIKINNNNPSVSIKADASEVLKTPTTIDLSKLSSVTDFHNSAMIADNYKDMFSIIKVTNEK